MKDDLKMMIVDDNPDDRSLAIRELKRDFPNLEAVGIKNEEEFQDALDERNFDLVITDYRIRWTDGLKVLKKVRSKWPNCLVIMFTGTGNEEIAVQAMKAGLDDYIVKSSKHFVRLTGAVHSVLEKAKESKARKEAESLYEKLFNRVPVGLFSVSPEGIIREVNDELVRMLNYPDKETLLDKNVGETYADVEKRDELLETIKRKGVIRDFEVRLEKFDGETIWASNNAQVIKNEDGQLLHIEGSLKEITERKKAEQKLKENMDKIEYLHDISWKIGGCKNKRAVFDETIESAKNILNFHQCSILEKENDEVLVKATTEPRAEVGQVLPRDEGIYGKTLSKQDPLLIKDIGEVDYAKPAAPEYESVISVPIGEKRVFQAVSDKKGYFDERDLNLAEILVNHSKEALNRISYQEQLRESEEKYRTIFENTGTATAILEKDKTVSMANKKFAEYVGYTKEEIEGKKKWTEFVVKEDLKKMENYHRLRRVDPEAIPDHYIFEFINKFGDTGKMFLTVSVLPGSKKSIVSLLEITKYIEGQKALERTQELFRTTFENSSSGMMLIDLDKKILDVNERFLESMNYEENELLEKSLGKIFPEDLKNEYLYNLQELVSGSSSFEEFNAKIEDKEGEIVESKITASTVSVDEDKPYRILVQVVDV